MHGNNTILHSKKNWNVSQGLVVISCGTSGGLCTHWNPHFFHLVENQSIIHWLWVNLSHVLRGEIFSMINVYMSHNPNEKLQCWNSLLALQDINTINFLIIIRDFNTTLHSKVKRGGNMVCDPSREYLEDLISSLDLSDIKPKKSRYIWSNQRAQHGHIATHLDRFLVNNSYLEDNLSCSSFILPWGGYDHRPISLVLTELEDLGPILFCFNPLWAHDPSFHDVISSSWSC
jgi:hypothetical protein